MPTAEREPLGGEEQVTQPESGRSHQFLMSSLSPLSSPLLPWPPLIRHSQIDCPASGHGGGGGVGGPEFMPFPRMFMASFPPTASQPAGAFPSGTMK